MKALLALVLLFATGHGLWAQTFEQLLQQYGQNTPQERVFMQTDRSAYCKGDVMWVQGLITGLFDNKLSHKSEKITLELLGEDGFCYATQTLPASDGIVSSAIVLPESLPEGALFLNAFSDLSPEDNPYRRLVTISDSPLPRFRITLEFPKQVYFPGDAFSARLSLTDHFNEPLKKIDYEVVVSGKGRVVYHTEGRTGRSGTVDVRFDIPSRAGDESLTFDITASGKPGDESLSGIIPVYGENYHAFVLPEGTNLLAGEQSMVSLLVLDAWGRPFAEQAALVDEGQSLVQQTTVDANGMARFNFIPATGKSYYVVLTRPFLSERRIALPEIQQRGVNLVSRGSLGDQIVLEIKNTTGKEQLLTLVGMDGNEMVYHAEHLVSDAEIVRVDKEIFDGSYANFGLLQTYDHTVVAQRSVAIRRYDTPRFCRPLSAESAAGIRERMQFTLDCETEAVAASSFAAVYTAWTASQEDVVQITDLDIPIDYYRQLKIMGYDRLVGESGQVGDVSMAITPAVMNFKSMVGGKRSRQWWEERTLQEGMIAWNVMHAMARRTISGETTIYDNMKASGYFLASNPELLRSLKKSPEKLKPAYKTLLETGTEVLKVVYIMRPYQLEGNKIVFYGSRNSILAQQGALIVVDGVRLGEDASVLNNISPFDVDEINISTEPMDIQRYTGLNSVGLIEITTKRGGEQDGAAEQLEPAPEQFDSPDYSKNASRNKGGDLRHTIYWHTTSGSLHESLPITFYNADIRGMVEVTWNLLLRDGRTQVLRSQYEVK